MTSTNTSAATEQKPHDEWFRVYDYSGKLIGPKLRDLAIARGLERALVEEFEEDGDGGHFGDICVRRFVLWAADDADGAVNLGRV